MQVHFTAKAYLASYYDIQDVANGSQIPLVCTDNSSGYYEKQGYSLIGTATVMIELHTNDQIMAAKLEALQAQLQTVRAENQQRENAILDKISKLTAISYDDPL